MSTSPRHMKRQRPGTAFGIFVPLSEEEAEDLLIGDDNTEDDYDEEEYDDDDDQDDWDRE